MSMMHLLAGMMPRSPTLAQKGYGHVYGASNTANLAMSYANVDGGSAPAAGDLVVWYAIAADAGGAATVDLTGSGWAQTQTAWTGNIIDATILAKVATAGDLSSPPTMVTSPTGGSLGFWVAYTVNGNIAALSVSSMNIQYSNASAPSNQVADSSALSPLAVAITIGMGAGDDGSPTLSISGATADIEFATAANAWGGSTLESRIMVNATIGGAAITFSKGDDGNSNQMVSGYVAVS